MKNFLLVAAAFVTACSPGAATPQQPSPQSRYYTDPPQVGYTPVVYDSHGTGLERTLDVFIFTAPNGCQWLTTVGSEGVSTVEYKGPDHQQICVPRDE